MGGGVGREETDKSLFRPKFSDSSPLSLRDRSVEATISRGGFFVVIFFFWNGLNILPKISCFHWVTSNFLKRKYISQWCWCQVKERQLLRSRSPACVASSHSPGSLCPSYLLPSGLSPSPSLSADPMFSHCSELTQMWWAAGAGPVVFKVFLSLDKMEALPSKVLLY